VGLLVWEEEERQRHNLGRGGKGVPSAADQRQYRSKTGAPYGRRTELAYPTRMESVVQGSVVLIDHLVVVK
jgi:hypothetical protein